MRQRQRDMARGEREQMEYDDYNWLELVNNGSLSKLVISELNKYLKKHNLNTTGNKHAKMQIIKRHIQTLGDASMETSDAENVESNIAEEESEDSDHDEQLESESIDEGESEANDQVYGVLGSDSSDSEQEEIFGEQVVVTRNGRKAGSWRNAFIF